LKIISEQLKLLSVCYLTSGDLEYSAFTMVWNFPTVQFLANSYVFENALSLIFSKSL